MDLLVTNKACDVVASAVMPDGSIDDNFSLKRYFGGYMGLLFFYPMDFTFVCPSELIALHNRMDEFNKRKCRVAAISVDSKFTHAAYRRMPVDQGGIGEVAFPIIADIKKEAARDYGILLDSSVALRGTFIMDANFVVRHQTVNDLPLGRNIDEIIRVVDAMLFHQEHGEVCPANWQKGEGGMVADQAGVTEYLSKNAHKI